MPSRSLDSAFARLRVALGQHDEVGLPDARLLADFINRRDHASFAVLLRRHAPVVMGVCLRVLRNRQDAEDAFQATFLVMVRKAASIAQPELLAHWLYRVAYKTALKAHAAAWKRRLREGPLFGLPEPAVNEPASRHDLLPFLDQELSRLSEKYRVPIILCDLEGKTQKKAALLLGCPEKTLSSRLLRGREMLAKRLTRLGLAVSAVTLPAALTQNAALAAPSLICSTVKAASLLAAGNAASGGIISANVAVLMEGVLQAMFVKKITLISTIIIGLGLAGFGGGRLVLSTGTAQQSQTGTALAQGTKDDGGGEKKKEAPKGDSANADKKGAEAQNEPYVYKCVYIHAWEAASIVKDILVGPIDPNQPKSKVAISSDDRTNSIVVIGTPDKIALAKTVLKQIDVGTVPVHLPPRGKSPKTLAEVAAELKNAHAYEEYLRKYNAFFTRLVQCDSINQEAFLRQLLSKSVFVN